MEGERRALSVKYISAVLVVVGPTTVLVVQIYLTDSRIYPTLEA